MYINNKVCTSLSSTVFLVQNIFAPNTFCCPILTKNGMFFQIFVKLSYFMKIKYAVLKLLHVGRPTGRQTACMAKSTGACLQVFTDNTSKV
jgi:hypothetical protein